MKMKEIDKELDDILDYYIKPKHDLLKANLHAELHRLFLNQRKKTEDRGEE